MTIRALLVDDDPDTRAITALSLDLHPRFDAHAVSRFEAAVALCRGTELFDVILLDMKLADIGVGALIATIRQCSASTAAPLLILSPRTSDADWHACHAAGALGTIGKPFDPLTLPDRVIDLLEPAEIARRFSAN